MAGEQQITSEEVVASILAFPRVEPMAPIEDENIAATAFEALQRENPNLAGLIEQQVKASYPAVLRLISQQHAEAGGPATTAAEREKRNHDMFALITKISAVSVLNAIGQAIRQQNLLETIFELPSAERTD